MPLAQSDPVAYAMKSSLGLILTAVVAPIEVVFEDRTSILFLAAML